MKMKRKKDSSPPPDSAARSVAAFKAAFAPLDDGNKKGATPARVSALSQAPTKRNRDD